MRRGGGKEKPLMGWLKPNGGVGKLCEGRKQLRSVSGGFYSLSKTCSVTRRQHFFGSAPETLFSLDDSPETSLLLLFRITHGEATDLVAADVSPLILKLRNPKSKPNRADSQPVGRGVPPSRGLAQRLPAAHPGRFALPSPTFPAPELANICEFGTSRKTLTPC